MVILQKKVLLFRFKDFVSFYQRLTGIFYDRIQHSEVLFVMLLVRCKEYIGKLNTSDP